LDLFFVLFLFVKLPLKLGTALSTEIWNKTSLALNATLWQWCKQNLDSTDSTQKEVTGASGMNIYNSQ
jgi:hypothetical protein